MTFERPWLLFVLILPVLWAAWNWRASRRRGALILKTLTFCSIIAALAAPQLTVFEEKVAVAVLVDTSASTSDEDLRTRIGGGFGDRARARTEHGRDSAIRPDHAPAERRGAQGRKAALHHGGTGARDGSRSRSAGGHRFTAGGACGARGPDFRWKWRIAGAWRAQRGRPGNSAFRWTRFRWPAGRRPLLHLDAVTLPSQAFTGERFPIDVMVSSPKRANAKVEISAEGKVLGTSAVSLQPGTNQVRVQASLTTTGAVDLAGRISSPELGEVRFAQAVALQRPRLLMVSDDPPGTGMHLLKTLEAAEFQVEQVRAVPAP